nr:hypothetical protein [Desulfobacula sp.]
MQELLAEKETLPEIYLMMASLSEQKKDPAGPDNTWKPAWKKTRTTVPLLMGLAQSAAREKNDDKAEG